MSTGPHKYNPDVWVIMAGNCWKLFHVVCYKSHGVLKNTMWLLTIHKRFQGDPKQVKSISSYKSFGQKFSEYFELTSLI